MPSAAPRRLRRPKSAICNLKSKIPLRRPLFESLENRSLLAAIAPPDGLVSWWTGDNTAADLAGVHNGTLSGGTTYTAGKVGQAFKFDGINDAVLLAGTFGGGPEATIEAWVKSTGSTGDFQAIVSAVESYFVHLQLGTGGNNVAYTNGDVVGFPIIQTTPAGEYRHIAMSLKSGDSRLYVNGELAAVSPVTYSTLLPTSNLRIGSGYQGGRYFKGEIDEVSYYDRALSATEVQHIYSADSDGKIKSSVYIAANAVSVSEGAAGSNAVATFDLKRVGNLSGPVTVNWSTADRTATATSDYASASGQVVFADGQSQQTVEVTLNGDDIPEADETFDLVLSTASPGYQVGRGVGVILNDDLGISISDATATEGGTALKILDRFVQANSGGLQRPRTPLFGPDANGDGAQDLYVVSADTDKILLYDGRTGDFLRTFVEDSGRLINPGDIAFGPDGNLYVSSLGFPTGTTPIPDAGKVLRYDGTSGAYLNTVMTGLSHPLGVTVASDGTVFAASQDSDQIYRTKGGVTSVFISAGSGGLNQPRNVLVGPDITGDGQADLYVSSQSYDGVLRYSGQTGAFIDKFASTGLGTGPSWIEFAPDGTLVATALTTTTCCNISYVRFNGTTGAKIDQLDTTTLGWAFSFGPDGLIYAVYMTAGLESYVDRVGPSSVGAFTISLNATSAAPVSVDYATSPGSAGADDFSAASGTITFAPGETSRVVLVPTLDDAAVEPSETFTVNLSNAAGAQIADGSGTATIADDDASRQITISDATATEGSSAMKFIDEFVRTGSGGLNGARNMIFRNGELYVVSAVNDSVLRYDAETGAFKSEFVTSGSGGLDYPQGIVFDSLGNLYVASEFTDEILRYDANGVPDAAPFVAAGVGGLNGPHGIAIGPDGHLYVACEFDKVLRFQGPTGANPGQFIDQFANTNGAGASEVAFGPDGKLYLTVGNGIRRSTGVSGAPMETFILPGSGGLSEIRNLHFDASGNLLVVSQANDQVVRFQGPNGFSPGAFVDAIVPSGLGGLDRPIGVTLDSVGNIYVSSYINNEVLHFRRSWLISDQATRI
jgi:sugar lactone lactonase YvrE